MALCTFQAKSTWPRMHLFPAGYQNLKCIPAYNGPHWHRLRTIYAKYLVQSARAMSFKPVRVEDITMMLKNLKSEMDCRATNVNLGHVSLRPHLRSAVFKLLYNICFGKRMDHILAGIGSHKDPNVTKLEELFLGVVRLGPAFIISDFLPAACHLPTPIDLQRASIAKKLDKVWTTWLVQAFKNQLETLATCI